MFYTASTVAPSKELLPPLQKSSAPPFWHTSLCYLDFSNFPLGGSRVIIIFLTWEVVCKTADSFSDKPI